MYLGFGSRVTTPLRVSSVRTVLKMSTCGGLRTSLKTRSSVRGTKLEEILFRLLTVRWDVEGGRGVMCLRVGNDRTLRTNLSPPFWVWCFGV